MDLSTIAPVQKVAVKTFHRGVLLTKKFSPQILTGVGVVGVVASTIMAGKATLKLEPVVADVKAEVAVAKELKHTKTADEYSSTQYKRDITQAYTRGAMDLVKIYGPAATTLTVSLVCLVSAQGIMHKRNAAIAAAFKSTEQAFAEYRARVKEEFGEDKDRDFRAGIRDVEVTDEDGTKRIAAHIDHQLDASRYARFFDEGNPNWEKKAEYNLLFLKSVQNHMNDLLHVRGHVMLNDVYDRLGFDRTPEGAIVGWLMGGEGDNYIDFNIYDFQSEAKRDFVNGVEPSILLDFNVDGMIYEHIGFKR
jgi:hypothetical protein